MRLIYSVSIQLYWWLAIILSAFNQKARLFVRGRSNLFNTLQETQLAPGKRVWIHAASLGEFEQGRPIIEALKKNDANVKIIITFFSPSGYEIRKDYPLADCVTYIPIDTKRNARKFIEILHPDLAIFIKYEFWPNFLNELYHRSIPSFSVSSIFRKDQIFFRPWGGFFLNGLKSFHTIFVQDKLSLQILERFGLKNVQLSGDTRIDRVIAIAEERQDIHKVEKFKNDRDVMVVGSSWREDLNVLIPFINSHRELKFIIAPHKIEEKELEYIEHQVQRPNQRLSSFYKPENCDVLIIDNIGLLSSVYFYGKYAYIGGAFGDGLHNILEAAVYGMPLFFGNKQYRKFKEATDLITLEAAFPIGGIDELEKHYARISSTADVLKHASKVAKDYVYQNQGAVKIVMDSLKKLFSEG